MWPPNAPDKGEKSRLVTATRAGKNRVLHFNAGFYALPHNCDTDFLQSPRARGMRNGSIAAFVQHPGNLFQVSRGGLRLGRIGTMLAGVPVADRCARVTAPVHPASPFPVHRWRLALHSQAGPGKAARGFGQPLRLHGIV